MPTCNTCGAFVTPAFARVFGDNHEELSGCLACTNGADLRDGSGGR